MAQGKSMKKGFFFYLGTLAVLFLAVFLILLVIMIFSPGTKVFGMTYFTSNDSGIIVLKDKDREDLGNLTEYDVIEVNGGYANVTVQKNAIYQYDVTGAIVIRNMAKGFGKAKNVKELSYSLTTSNEGGVKKLTIDIAEPKGFLYLSKDVKVTIQLGSGHPGNFNNTDFIFNLDGGDVNIGGVSTNDAKLVNIKSLTASTGKGDVYFTESAVAVVDSLDISTSSGDIWSYATFNGGTGLSVANSAKVYTKSGKIQINNLTVANGTGSLDLDCISGRLICNNINASLNIRCEKGNYTIGEITGEVSFAPSENDMKSPVIKITKIGNGLYMPNGGNAKITIHEVYGETYVKSKSGYVKIGGKDSNGNYGGAHDEVMVETEKGDVTLYVADNNKAGNNVLTKKGDIKVYYLGSVLGTSNNFKTTGKGTVSLNFTTDASMKITLMNNNGVIFAKGAKNVKYSLQNKIPNDNPCYVNCDSESVVNEVNVYCTKKIKVNLVNY